MQTILRGLRILCMALWVGGIVYFVNVAQIAFSSLPTIHLAGIIVRGSLGRLHQIGLITSAIFLLATAAQIYIRRRDKHLVRSYSLSLVFLVPMVLCTLYSSSVVIPRMERDRQTAMQTVPEIDSLPSTNPIRMDFDRLHQQSTWLEEAVLLFGLGIIALLGREPHLTAQR